MREFEEMESVLGCICALQGSIDPIVCSRFNCYMIVYLEFLAFFFFSVLVKG